MGNKSQKSGGGKIIQSIQAAFSGLNESIKRYFHDNPETVEAAKDFTKKIGVITLKVGLAIIVLWLLMILASLFLAGLGRFWNKHEETIIIVVGLTIAAVLLKIYFFPTPQTPVQPPDIVSQAQLEEWANKNDDIVKPIIFNIARNANQLCGLAPVVDESDIFHDPPHTVVNCELTIHHLQLSKPQDVVLGTGNSVCDITFIKKIYRTRIWQWLSSGKIQTVSPRFVYYDGRPYPALIIYDVVDIGLNVRIDVVFASAANLKRLDARERAMLVTTESDGGFLD